ncbi:aminoacyl-histidine dipeptidase [Ornithobacterium rhinotracheale]|uniref:Cytosol non-specific dipeptidase n=1 Tax=Ornithobacterium rhinotracheale (strain ATCC 51463 / DSM 15997 / CCUG 23171 / CIP 104009 / LMG 9086) TaxID=867902 RepID=I3ZZ83_ORNRL|nr:aminoacyl-histidine dipeptidase [Ornithobacterium rhinotracheale]AFL97017.1 aminoacyl-histidine dipeptidase [Ornithobacterium rhinotracheale DSM 15997]AIP99148.1 aminoacyl-histidine dipeptidase [Ornithobacterium rhinotracheale ORT-UMN 88]KGB67028.1 aminoacyl-histidine dipeptidase [Ornithobacterium rhinotracheale H06-030791]MCK0194465.1 aminoacyl-histidine dipeptidase [Ornithobacterium rhinotracheale]UOH64563.1 aminoacyl-histidine dipeptidase [Ornithobacterium rhinotracheale]
MNQEIRNLEPKALWNFFADLNAVPRPSKKEEKVRQFMKDFGQKLGLETKEDAIGNVVIKKPATPGMEDRKTLILQSHLDMVHQKNNDTVFDFNKQGIEMEIKDGWVTAKGTTLGADNGLGVAAIMAILDSKDIAHPAIEALFTIDEETGMTGAKKLDGSNFEGKILLNLDTEEDNEIGIGCAGGVDVSGEGTYDLIPTVSEEMSLKITVKGLNGGHSGMEIHKGLGNANKILAKLIDAISDDYKIHSIDGGGLRNAIPREATATLVMLDVSKAEREVEDKAWKIKEKLSHIDPNLTVLIEADDKEPKDSMTVEDSKKFIKMLNELHNGVFKMSEDVEGLVEASNNVARVIINNGKASVYCLTRSSVEESKKAVVRQLTAALSKAGLKVSLDGDYPGWAPNPKSEILAELVEQYKKLFNEEPNVAACHAGLECGIIAEHIPGLDMVSFGPTILGAHSPEEKANIESVQKFWTFLLAILKDAPKK